MKNAECKILIQMPLLAAWLTERERRIKRPKSAGLNQYGIKLFSEQKRTVNTSIFGFTKSPHRKEDEVLFYNLEDDGFVSIQHKGRVDKNDLWPSIRDNVTDCITGAEEWKSHIEFTHDKEAIVYVIGAGGSLGRSHYAHGKFIASNLCLILTPKDKAANRMNVTRLDRCQYGLRPNLSFFMLQNLSWTGVTMILSFTFTVNNSPSMTFNMSIKILVFSLICCTQVLYSQNPWHTVTVHRSREREEISFFDRQNGLVIVNNRLQKTIDGGLNWYEVDLGAGNIEDIHILDSRHGFVVDDDGNLHKTFDGGESWQKGTQKSHSLELVHFADNSNGIVKWLNFVYITSDGGQSWTIKTFNSPQPIHSIYMLSPDTLFVGRSDGLYHSTDGGNSWTQNNSLSNSIVSAITFTNDSIGFALQSGNIYKTSDRGISWSVLNTGATLADPILDLDFFDENYGAISGREGWVQVTTDGGQTWQKHYVTSIRKWSYVDVLDQNTVIVSGEKNYSAISDDFGTSWNSLTASLPHYANSAHFFNMDTGFVACENGKIFRTRNGAKSWQEIPSPTTKNLTTILFTDERNGMAIGDSATILRTENGGDSWQLIPNNINHNIYFKSFILGTDSFYLGDGTALLRSFDGGRSFDSLTVPDPYIKSVHFKDHLNGIFLTAFNLYTTVDGGQSWQLQFPRLNPTSAFTCMGWLNDSVGFLDTKNDSLFKSTDYGRTWYPMAYSDKWNSECVPVLDTLVYLRDSDSSPPDRTFNNGTLVQREYGCGTGSWYSRDLEMVSPWLGYQVGHNIIKRSPDSIMDIETRHKHYCPGTEVSVALRVSGDWVQNINTYSSFDLQLSDINGNFTTPTVIGNFVAARNCDVPSRFLNGTIPTTTPNGNYFLRVVSTNPSTTGPKIPITINNQPDPHIAINSNSDTLCGTQHIKLDVEDRETGSLSMPSWFVNGDLMKRSYSFSSDSINHGDTIVVTASAVANRCYADTLLTDTIIVAVSDLPQPQIIPSTSKLHCDGDSILLDAGSYHEFRWNTGDTSQLIYVKQPGEYWVKVKNTYGCEAFDTLLITQAEPLQVDPQVNDESCAGRKNGSVVLNITGGTPPYNIFWQDTSTSSVSRTDLHAGLYSYQITDSMGCSVNDSVEISTSPVFNQLNFDTICAGTTYFFPDGDTASFSITDTSSFLSSYGCDSIIVTHLEALPATKDSISAAICPGDSILFAGRYYSDSGLFSDTLLNQQGCDSIRTLNLSHFKEDSVNQSFKICANDTVEVGSKKYYMPGIYLDTLPNVNACDSIVKTEISLDHLNDSISLTGFTLSAQSIGLDYQWLDCDNGFSPIPGEVNPQYHPKKQGRYAVMITDGVCIDTSDCIEVQGIGIPETLSETYELYPNPNSGKLYLEMNSSADYEIKLYNATGQQFIVEYVELGNGKYLFNTEELSSGAYFLRIFNDEGYESAAFIKR